MALDFPNAPTLNQTFTAPNGTIWLWDGVKWTATTSTSPFTGQGNVGRNLLHNPLFNVAQRGAGPFTGNSTYTADRWMISVNLDTSSIARQVMADASRTQIGDEAAAYFLNNTFTGNAGAGAFNAVTQQIEDVRRLAGKTVTVSFWAVAGVGGLKLGVSLNQIFGTGGSPSAYVPTAGQAVTLTTSFARYALTLTLPSVVGKTLGSNGDSFTQLVFWCSSGSTNAVNAGNIGVQSGTVSLWGVQLEIGSVATPLEKPDPRYDLANCQRFYLATTTLIGQATVYATTLTFPSTMRANPTLTGGGPGFAVAAVSTVVISMVQTSAGAQAMTFSADL